MQKQIQAKAEKHEPGEFYIETFTIFRLSGPEGLRINAVTNFSK